MVETTLNLTTMLFLATQRVLLTRRSTYESKNLRSGSTITHTYSIVPELSEEV